MAELTTIKSFFTSIQVHFSDMWLESCIHWCKTETLSPNYTPKELQSKVYEQWLLLDLRDVEVAVLPPHLSTKQHYTLTGNFCLQMMQIVDISKPKLWQLQKIRNSNALTRGTQQDSDIAGTGKRLLQMTLTDGVQEIEAMEYRPVPTLRLNLAPGTKMRVMGPVVVRRGRLMLEQQNVKVLGGEVEELLVANASENVLARALKLPLNPNPGAIEERLLAVEKEEKDEGYLQVKNVKPQVLRQKVAVDTMEGDLTAEEIEMLLEAEAEFDQTRRDDNKTPDLFDEGGFSRSRTSTQVAPMSLDDDDDVFNDIDIDAHLDQVESAPVAGPSVITIAKLIQNKNNISKGVFRIRAKFKSVEEKLTVSDGEYKLVIKVEDASGDLVVRVHSDVISEFAECTPTSIMSLKSNVLGKNKEAIEKMMQVHQSKIIITL